MIQWFPGHMAKAKREIAAALSLVDIVFELVDARVPTSSRNPMLSDIIKNKPRLVIMTKAAIADPAQTPLWEREIRAEGREVLTVDAVTGENIKKITPMAGALATTAKKKVPGMKARPVRAMIIGIPNVGKSTLINRLVGRRAAAVGSRPGVTKAQQWIRINPRLELLDTPGILWPKFEDRAVAMHLALTGAIKSEILSFIEIGEYFIDFLRDHYPDAFKERYGIEAGVSKPDLARHIASTRGVTGDDYYEKAFALVINDFQNARVGRITLDRIEKPI